MSNRFTAEEMESIADLVAAKVIAQIPVHVCVFSPDDQVFMRSLASGARGAKKTAVATIVGTLVLGAIAFLGAAIIEWGRRTFGGAPGVTP